MKKNIYIILSVLVFSFMFIACEDEDKEMFNTHAQSENVAPYVRILSNAKVIDATKLETAGFSGTLSAPGNNVASWTVRIRRTANGETSDFADLTTVNSFPSEFSVTGVDIAAALGINISDIQPGDNIEFSATSTGIDGSVLTFDQLANDLAGQPEQRQAYNFGAFVSCAFIADDIAGTYNVTQHRFDAFFGAQPSTREVIAGPKDNQFTIIGGPIPLDGSDDLIIDVDPTTGIVTDVANPNGIHFNTFGPGVYGNASGFAFSCAGFIDLTISSPGFIANFFTLEKQ